MKTIQTWLNQHSGAILRAWLLLAVLTLTLSIVRGVLHKRGKTFRYYARRSVKISTDWFFDNVVRIRLNKIIEWTSSLGLLALLAGQAMVVVSFQEVRLYGWASFVAAGQGISGAYQLYAVTRGDLAQRIEATALALSSWTITLIVLVSVYAPQSLGEAQMLFAFGLPLSLVQLLFCFLQSIVLLRYQMYPQRPEAVRFAYAVVSDLEERFRQVFKIPGEVKTEVKETIERIATEWQLK